MTDDKRRKAEDTIAELDLRLDGLLGKLGASLGEMVERLERGEDGEVRRSHEIRTPKGPLRAETGVRVRVGGAQFAAGGPDSPESPVGRAARAWTPAPGAPRARPTRAGPQGEVAPGTGTGTGAGTGAGTDSGTGPGDDASSEAAATTAAPVRKAELEPHLANGRWVLCADLPGVSLPDISVEIVPASDAEPHGAVQVATRGTRRYEARHGLVAGLDTGDMSLVLRNGVLEISFGQGGVA